jgi:hypothetical protein
MRSYSLQVSDAYIHVEMYMRLQAASISLTEGQQFIFSFLWNRSGTFCVVHPTTSFLNHGRDPVAIL